MPGFLQTLILVSSDQRILVLMVWESFRSLLAYSRQAAMCLLLRSGLCLAIQAWLVECSRNDCPSGRLSSLQRAMLKLSESDHQFLITALLPIITQTGLAASSRKSSCGSKLPFTDEVGRCAHWDWRSQRHRNKSVPFSRSVLWHDPLLEVYR